jgi:tRNA(fMet)-specific endonuclease VapC
MEEVLYDTSALIDHLKRGEKSVKGFTTILNVVEFPKALDLKGLGIIYPTVEDYDEAVKIAIGLLNMGKPIPAVDILIGAVCLRRGLTLVTADVHFKHIKSMRNELRLKPTA